MNFHVCKRSDQPYLSAHSPLALLLTNHLNDTHLKPPEIVKTVASKYVSRNNSGISPKLERSLMCVLMQPHFDPILCRAQRTSKTGKELSLGQGRSTQCCPSLSHNINYMSNYLKYRKSGTLLLDSTYGWGHLIHNFTQTFR